MPELENSRTRLNGHMVVGLHLLRSRYTVAASSNFACAAERKHPKETSFRIPPANFNLENLEERSSNTGKSVGKNLKSGYERQAFAAS